MKIIFLFFSNLKITDFQNFVYNFICFRKINYANSNPLYYLFHKSRTFEEEYFLLNIIYFYCVYGYF